MSSNTGPRRETTGTTTGADDPSLRADGGGSSLRTVGVLGGMSAESTTHYYERLNAGVNDAHGGHTAAPVVIFSVNFADIERMISENRWAEAGEYLAERASRLDAAGVEFVVMATNTMHRVADDISDALSVPFVHIVDPVADASTERGIDTLGILGTQVTMEGDFYSDRFAEFGIETVAPDADARAEVDRIVFEELVHGEIREESREYYLDVIDSLREQGAEGIVLGCTEIEMLVDETDVPELAVFDTTALHVERAVELCLGERDLR